MVAENVRFSIPDYCVFAASLLASLGIGIYSSFTGKKGQTSDDFYFGNHDMNVVAVAMSLAATFLSAIGILGVPSEVYHYGISYILMLVGEFICSTISIFLFVPFFYNLKLPSVYEYFEHRFNWTLRRCACLIFMINMMLYMSLVLYAPALALSQVSALPLWASIITTGLICTIYTSIGGMKAVIWTDAFQMGVMLTGIMTILIHGLVIAGGPAKVFQDNLENGRMQISSNPDPFIRQSMWSLLIGGFFTILPFGMNQATVQRYLSVKNKRAAQKVIAIQCPTTLIWWSLLICVGLTMYTYYQGCDPRIIGRTERTDQTMALFVLDTLGYLQGLPGLFTAVVYSATLSTVSSGVNSIVIVLMEDFIKPLSNPMTDRTAMRLSKGLSFFVGFLAIGMAMMTSLMGQALIQFTVSIEGICGGPLLGLFFCGMMLPFCNSKGVTIGVIAGLGMTFWLGIGSIIIDYVEPPLPLDADSCPIHWIPNITSTITVIEDVNSTLATIPVATMELFNATVADSPLSASGLHKMYRLSYQYYGLVGFAITVALGIIFSLLTGGEKRKIPDRFFLYKAFSKTTEEPEEIMFEHTAPLMPGKPAMFKVWSEEEQERYQAISTKELENDGDFVDNPASPKETRATKHAIYD